MACKASLKLLLGLPSFGIEGKMIGGEEEEGKESCRCNVGGNTY